MGLSTYKHKRNFSATSEPKPVKKSSKSNQLTFVVQRHKASHLHYDFRLEMEGALKSWAIPKGPSLNPSDKRLAMMVEDHPLEYAKFKGVIPEGNYGAGIVEIWDSGTYEPINEIGREEAEKQLVKDLKKGSLKFRMHGKKLKGEFALVKMKTAENNTWLLIKHKDKFAINKSYSSENDTPINSPINQWLKQKKGNLPAGKAGKTSKGKKPSRKLSGSKSEEINKEIKTSVKKKATY